MNRKFARVLKNIKAQMTVFIVLGFVILIIFMMLSLVAQSVKKTRIQGEAKKALQSFVETSTIQQYILSCVDIVLEDGIEKISLQGGQIYDYQYNESGFGINTSEFVMGGDYITVNLSALPLVNNPYVNETNKTINISYAMKMSNNSGNLPYLPGSSKYPPIYPFPFKSLAYLNGFNYLGSLYIPMLEGFYGEVIISKLCVAQHDCGVEDSARFNNFNTTTFEEQLESYLEVKVQECVNFTYFEEMTPHTIERGNITAEVIFSVDKVSAVLDYPITLYWRGAEPVTDILKFNKNKNIRLSKLYKLAHTILKYESFDLFFDPIDYKSIFDLSVFFSCRMPDGSRCYDRKISVTKIPNVCADYDNARFDDLIVIQDSSSKINGVPLQLQLLIENRRPALDYISLYPLTDIDIIVFENQTLDLTPEAYDPDNTNVWYDYSGWRENYWTWFDKTLWFLDPPSDPVNFDFSNYTSQSPLGSPYFIQYFAPEPHNWTNSQEFINTEQNASCYIEYGDLGLHKVNVTIWDEEGLKDWQEVRILVRDLPKAIANGSNNFSDIGDANASVEDPYILDASLSYSVIGELADEFWYHWHEFIEPINIQTNDLITILPNVASYDIFNILNLVFKNEKLSGQINRSAVVSLAVGLLMPDGSVVYGEPAYLNLQVHQCLPHVNADDPHTPYPYNDTLGFQATHACCGNGTDGFLWGERKDDTSICYNITEHAALRYFLIDEHYDDWYAPEPYLGIGTPNYFDYPGPTFGVEENNVFTREFNRSCDSTRGNICNGSGTYQLIVAHDCNYTLLPHQAESCYGPPVDYFLTSEVSGTADGCVVYEEGNTFEKLNQGLSNSRACSGGSACYGVSDLVNKPLFKDDEEVVFRTAESVGNDPANIINCTQAFCSGETYTGTDPLGNCANVLGVDCSCSDNCYGDPACNTHDPGYNIPPTLNTWCDISCTAQDCGLYNFDSGVYSCYGQCSDSNDCFGDYVCDLPNVAGNECLGCDYNTGLQTTVGTGFGNCEQACYAHSYCDEKPQGALVVPPYNSGAGCNQTCDFIDCTGNYAFDSITFTCFETCTNNAHCEQGYLCQLPPGNCI